MSKFTATHLNSFDLLRNAKIKQVKEQLPSLADAYVKRSDDLRRDFSLVIEQIESIKTSGRFSPDGTRTELRLATRGFTEQKLAQLRKDTVDKLETQRSQRQEALLAPKKTSKDPALALIHELQLQEVRRELRTLDPLVLQTRLKLAATTEAGDLLLEAIESDPVSKAGGTPIVGADVLRDAKAQMAMAADPQLSEIAMLRDAYSFLLGATENMILEASGLSTLEVSTDPTPAKPASQAQPFLVSTGQPVAQ